MQAKEPLHEAAKDGDVERVSQLLGEGRPVDERSEAGYTPLVYAVANRHLKVVRLLLGAGADAGAIAGDGGSLVHFGVLGGGLQIMKLLLRAGAPVDAPDANGYSPLQKAIQNRASATQLIGPLIEAGADVEREMPEGGSILNAAVLAGRTEVVELLLGAGARASAEEGAAWDMSPGSIIVILSDDWLRMRQLLTSYLGEPPPDRLRDIFASMRKEGASGD